MAIIDIYNGALGLLGNYSIPAGTNLTTGTSVVGVVPCNLFYETVRKSLLRETDWNFSKSIKRYVTSDLQTVPTGEDGWEYAYNVPTDFLKIRQVKPASSSSAYVDVDDNGGVDFEMIAAGMFLTNQENPDLVYSKDLIDDTLWDVLFRETVITLLAVKICREILGKDTETLETLWEMHKLAKGAAALANLTDRKITVITQSRFLSARRRGYRRASQ